jgi:hypothetical protein
MANLNESKKHHFLYKTTNLKTKKFYIGVHSTNNLQDGYLGSGKRLRYSIRKYGRQNFKLEMLEIFTSRDDLLNKEKYLINDDLLSNKMCLNLQYGGQGGGFINEKHRKKFFKIAAKDAKRRSLLGQQKFRELLKNNEWRNNHIKNQKEGYKKYFETHHGNWLGRHHKDESKKIIGQKNSVHQQGSNNSQYGTCWITNNIANKKIKKTDIIPEGWTLGRTIK